MFATTKLVFLELQKTDGTHIGCWPSELWGDEKVASATACQQRENKRT